MKNLLKSLPVNPLQLVAIPLIGMLGSCAIPAESEPQLHSHSGDAHRHTQVVTTSQDVSDARPGVTKVANKKTSAAVKAKRLVTAAKVEKIVEEVPC